MVPYISVILTSKDRYPLIRLAVQSVLSQTFQGFELIVVDDDSKDPELLSYLDEIERHPKITVVRTHTEDREGLKMVAVMANRGLDEARGEYVTYICDDDIFLPHRLKTIVPHLVNNDMVVDAVEWVDVDGKRTSEKELSYNYPRPLLEGHWDLLKSIGRKPNYICHDCVVHKKTIHRWPTDLENPVPVDWRFWLCLSQEGFKIKKIRTVGSEAYRPGVWREGLEMKEALKSRNLEALEMKNRKAEIRFAKNVSNKRQVLNDGNLVVYPGERVEIEHVTSPSGALYPGFVYDSALDVPEVARISSDPGPHEPKLPVEDDIPGTHEDVRVKQNGEPETPEAVLKDGKKASFKKVEKAAPKKPVQKYKHQCSACGKKLSGPTKTGMCRGCYNKSRKG